MKHPLMVTLTELPAFIVLTITYVIGVGLAALMIQVTRLWRGPERGWRAPARPTQLDSLY